MLLLLYRILSLICVPFVPFYLRMRLRKGKEEALRLPERYGRASIQRPKGKLIWIHAASVGEVLSTKPLIKHVNEKFPKTHILFTSGTCTSAKLMKEMFPQTVIHQYLPLDAPSFVRRFGEHWAPDLVIWIESELWPNHLHALYKNQIPAFLINARLSEKSSKRWRFLKKTFQRLVRPFYKIYVQSEKDRDQYRKLGIEPKYQGNLKTLAAPLPYAEKALEALKESIGKRPFWLATSTHEGEEDLLFQTHQSVLEKHPNALLILVPRHPERGVTLSFPGNTETCYRSRNQKIMPTTQLYIADTLGELGLFYKLSPFTFLGGSLVPIGGHNPIEPLKQGCLPLVGPYTDTFSDMMRTLSRHKMCQKITKETLTQRVLEYINKEEKSECIQEKAFSLFDKDQKLLQSIEENIE
ncbi:MAG: 3-deoxy-D-manno-octulosonic acid transferase, partial [Gammaproteobacteria bacterium]|nr:3-deoxy-D-manno-octulosonic acid transferase [Gammaproteobacteria bacterium]